MKKIKILILSLGLLGLTSCDKEPISQNANNYQPTELIEDFRIQFLNSGEHISTLTINEHRDVFISKLNQLLTNSLPSAEAGIIENLIIEFPKYCNGESNNVSTLGVQLANIVPEIDFILMFNELENYQYTGSYIGTQSVSEDMENDIASMTFFSGNNSNMGAKIKCNCNWTCGATYHSNYEPTSSWCGFMLSRPCRYASGDDLVPK